MKILEGSASGWAAKYSFSDFLCFFDFLWSSSISIVLNDFPQGWHFQLVVTDTLKFEFASTAHRHTRHNRIKLTGFLLFENIFRNWFKLSNLTLGIVNVKFSQAMELVAWDVLKLETTARANNFFFLLNQKS